MKRILESELKQIGIEMLNYVDTICRANDINYFIAFGTLIGAVRHKGFIPWDDDIDICISRTELNKLLKTIEKDGKYRVISMDNNPDYYFPFARICDPRTIVLNRPFRKVKDFGVWIDVFPLENAPKLECREEWLKEFYIRKKKMRATVPTPYEWNIINYLVKYRFLLRYYRTFKLRRKYGKENFSKFRKDYIDWIDILNTKQSNEYFVADTPYRYRTVFPKKYFDNAVDLEFEGLKVKAPKNYDEILRITYGDYMQLPPLKKRKSHHYFKAYWK